MDIRLCLWQFRDSMHMQSKNSANGCDFQILCWMSNYVLIEPFKSIVRPDISSFVCDSIWLRNGKATEEDWITIPGFEGFKPYIISIWSRICIEEIETNGKASRSVSIHIMSQGSVIISTVLNSKQTVHDVY